MGVGGVEDDIRGVEGRGAQYIKDGGGGGTRVEWGNLEAGGVVIRSNGSNK
jgi:hypothetical protein